LQKEDCSDRIPALRQRLAADGFIENEQLVMDMRVIAGKPYRRTPVFSDRVTYLVMNPSWEVPNKIAKKDLLPKIKKDPHTVLDSVAWSGWSDQFQPRHLRTRQRFGCGAAATAAGSIWLISYTQYRYG
jgi:hypothetical protein